MVKAVDLQPFKTLENVLETVPITADIQNILTAEHIVSVGASGTNYTVTGASGLNILGNSTGNVLSGGSGGDSLYGLGGNDTISGGGGSNVLDGGDGDDVLTGDHYSHNTVFGGAGNDVIRALEFSSDNVLEGGTGNDTLTGSNYSDTYRFNLGDGQDTITEGVAVYGGSDKLVFGSGIAASQLWFRQVGQNLDVSIIGTTDVLHVRNWYSGENFRIEVLQLANGQTLQSDHVQSLVDAMASWAPPELGQTVMPVGYVAGLQGVMEASWG
jgi:hypothetical protein